ncbi:hypothetical protein F5883DRAFT_96218 [Diaporthe sp. PMI_573]|nr:hypothetical protein F5883DRAFT_96218 [Diaporthaceae sp. PMI_573]
MHFNVFDELEAKPARLNDDDLESFPSESLPASSVALISPSLGRPPVVGRRRPRGKPYTRRRDDRLRRTCRQHIHFFSCVCVCVTARAYVCVCVQSIKAHTRGVHVHPMSSLHILLLGYMAGSLAQNHHPSAHPRPGGRRRKGGSRRRGCRRSPRDRPGGVIRPLCPSVCPRCAAPASLPASPPPLPPRENTHLFKKPSLMLQRRFCSVARQGWRLLLRVWHI